MSDNEFFERLRQNPRPVVVDFWAAWCGPCRMIEPVLKKVGQEYDGRVDVWKVNADEHPDLLRQLRIYGIPTLVGFNAGNEVARQTGVASPGSLGALFEAALSGTKPVRTGPAPIERLVRFVLGISMVGLAYTGGFSGWYLLMAGLGGAVLFSAVYDRCPIWQAVTPRLKALLSKREPPSSLSR